MATENTLTFLCASEMSVIGWGDSSVPEVFAMQT